MSFAYNGRNVPDINNYNQALQRYNEARCWRDGKQYGAERKLKHSDKRHHGIRLVPTPVFYVVPPVAPAGCAISGSVPTDAVGTAQNGITTQMSVALRYHHTDVVTWHPDNSITIDPYMSISTDNFIANALPSMIRTHFNHANRRNGEMLIKLAEHNTWSWWDDPEARIYALNPQGRGGSVHLKQDEHGVYQFDEGHTKPWRIPVVNKQRAREALANTNYSDIRHWLPAAYQLSAFKPDEITKSRWVLHNEILSMLDDRSRWLGFLHQPFFHVRVDTSGWSRSSWGHEPIKSYRDPRFGRGSATKTLALIRAAIYERNNCMDVDERPFLTNLREVSNYEKTRERYDWVK